MTSIITEPETPKTISEPTRLDGEQRIGIQGVSYKFYKQFCDEIGEQPIRLSYNEGCLEIMITKSPHEFFKKMLAKLVEATIFEMGVPVRSGGAMTFQRDDLEKGFEPDECWWIANESAVRKITDVDFTKNPPPDLAIEVEMSHSLAKRIAIYAAMGIAEVWRFNGQRLRFCVLSADRTYLESGHSQSFPFLRPDDLLPYLNLPDDTDETTRLRSYVNWLRIQRPSNS